MLLIFLGHYSNYTNHFTGLQCILNTTVHSAHYSANRETLATHAGETAALHKGCASHFMHKSISENEAGGHYMRCGLPITSRWSLLRTQKMVGKEIQDSRQPNAIWDFTKPSAFTSWFYSTADNKIHKHKPGGNASQTLEKKHATNVCGCAHLHMWATMRAAGRLKKENKKNDRLRICRQRNRNGWLGGS